MAMVVSGALAAPLLAQGGPPPAMVRFDEVRAETVQLRRFVTGEVRAAAFSRVAAKEAGLVLAFDLDPGDVVEKGQVIARLDDELMLLDLELAKSALEADRAVVAEREAELTRAERDLERLSALAQSDGAARRETEDARTAVTAMQARLEKARADVRRDEVTVRRAEKRLTDFTIRAPFSGRVVTTNTEIGEWLPEGGVIIELIDDTEVDVVLNVPEGYLLAMQAAAESDDAPAVAIRVDAAGVSLETRDIVIVPRGDELARTFPVRIRLDNTEREIKPGMAAVAAVPTGSKGDAITVSKDAILRSDIGWFVYYDAGGTAGVAPVQVEFAIGQRVVIREGMLSPGMRVVIEGNERIFPTQPLMELQGGPAGGPQEQAG